MATLIVPGEDFLKTVPLLGSTLSVKGVDGIVNVTDFAETLAVWKIKMTRKIGNNKRGRRANGRSDKPLALRSRLLCLVSRLVFWTEKIFINWLQKPDLR